MRAYIARRLLLALPTLLGVSILIFFMIHIIPGDVIDAMTLPGDLLADRSALEKTLGLDAPAIVQYARWMGFVPQPDGGFKGVLQGYLGESFMEKEPVSKLVAFAFPVTLELALMAFVIAQLVALPVGVYSAMRQDRLGDYIARSAAILGISVPAFWLGTMVIVFPALWWNYMPPIMLVRFIEDPIRNLKMFIVPAVILGVAQSAATTRMTRTMMLEVLRQDYIRTAWAKGLREGAIVIRHALKNALVPVVSMMGLQVPTLIGGTVIIEEIFCLPGMGRLIINALLKRDKFLVCGVVLVFAVLLILLNLLVDLIYGYLNAAIHYE